jgi:hypothetical protein
MPSASARKSIRHRAHAIDQRDVAVGQIAERDRNVERRGDLGGAAEADAKPIAPVFGDTLIRLGDVERDAGRGAPSLILELEIGDAKSGEQWDECGEQTSKAMVWVPRPTASARQDRDARWEEPFAFVARSARAARSSAQARARRRTATMAR